MYSQSVVFPRLAVIQSAKWKDRNGLWFGFRIIHYAAHNTPSPATAVLHTQPGRDWPHTRVLRVCANASKNVRVVCVYMYACVSSDEPTIEITVSPAMLQLAIIISMFRQILAYSIIEFDFWLLHCWVRRYIAETGKIFYPWELILPLSELHKTC